MKADNIFDQLQIAEDIMIMQNHATNDEVADYLEQMLETFKMVGIGTEWSRAVLEEAAKRLRK